MTSTAGDATLSVADSHDRPGTSSTAAFALPQALQISANGGAYAPVGGTLLTYNGPVSNDEVDDRAQAGDRRQ